MRVLHTARTLDPAWGGPVEVTRRISAESRKHGIQSEVLCQDDPQSSWLTSWDVPIHAAGGCALTFGYARTLDAWLAKNICDFDAVIVHGIWMYFGLAVRRAATRSRVPYYLFIHGALDPWFKKKYPYKHLKKMLYWRLFEGKVLCDAAAVLFTTQEERHLAQNSFKPYCCNPLVVGLGAASPPSPEPSAPRQRLIESLSSSFPALRNRGFILYLGRIHEKKGIDLLLRSFASIKDQNRGRALIVAGPGDSVYVSELKVLVYKLGLADQVVWTGPLYGDVKWLAMKAADAFALPSHQENFGMSVAEALACGTPVLISDKVNIWREVESDGAGLIETDDLEGSTRLLQRWFQLASDEKANMGCNAARCFSKRFDFSKNCVQLFDVLRNGGAKQPCDFHAAMDQRSNVCTD